MRARSARVTLLRSRTDARWLTIALADLRATLADHAHCEKKAAANALKLVADHADRPDLVHSLAKLAQEELQHFLAVLAEMSRLGVALTSDEGDPYAQALLRCVRGAEGRLLDRLLVAALIEARSCERLALLSGALEEPRLRELYARLAQSEAGHERLFLDLARRHAAGDVDARLAELAEEEARIVAGLPLLARIH
ncbi:MAG TPA: tRNA-(ms[2]io[6]A)-hydroxylase [Anaeromyxobacter sp.]|nr:tRNA-(ms[2]io[6]A)-hydroxylase [Anaeromyxobacter sp.]